MESAGPDLGGDVTSPVRLPSPAPLIGPVPCTRHTALSRRADCQGSPTLSISEFPAPQECFLNSRSGKKLTKGPLRWMGPVSQTPSNKSYSGVLTHWRKMHLRLFPFIFSLQSNSASTSTNTAAPPKRKRRHTGEQRQTLLPLLGYGEKPQIHPEGHKS